MMSRRSCLTTVAAALLVIGCADQPTAPQLSAVAAAPASARQGATLSGAVDQTIAGNVIAATVRVTRLTLSSAGQLLAAGVLSGTVNGVPFTQTFADVPATLSSGASSAASAVTAGVTAQQSSGTCDILFLDLGPLHLDILGLTVDLNQVVLDVAAQSGAGNLLGNLLCTVVHLFDAPAILVAIANILDQINAILGAI